MTISKEHKIITVAQLITAIGLAVLWLVYYLAPAEVPEEGGYRFVFDTTSPVPDAILFLTLCLAGVALLKAKSWGRPLSMVCAVVLIYLGVLDVGIPIQDKVFALSIIDITANGALNLWCIVLGLYTILKLKK